MGKIVEMFYVNVHSILNFPDIQTVVTLLQDEKNLDVEFVPLKENVLLVIGREKVPANEDKKWNKF